MIFITLGSQMFQFNRLLKALDEQVAEGKITDELFAQIGASDYKPRNFKYKGFLNRDEFAEWQGKAENKVPVTVNIEGTNSMSNKKKKLCFAASSGGHFEQIIMLKPLMEKYDSFLITEKTIYNTEIIGVKMYYLRQVNRKEFIFPIEMIVNSIKSFAVFIKEKPDIVITTGVLAMVPICLIAKLFGKKLIYIESFAKVNSANETGKLMYKFADQFYVQWPQMKKIYPKAIYLGGIY
ncbi:PssD/Cps14F family polysaccharide biosynthesis glycosyltransferase [Lachnospiraceae bacterium C1.1]|nr:PssD/Cps14F family polysaccharide biosynthesis glycosyltransferase [Lachnospiraceae bacterium C1.1]